MSIALNETTNSAAQAIGTREDGLIIVRPSTETMSKQHLPYYVGISGEAVGAQGISMNLIIIPPGGAAIPHTHRGYETAIYVLKGEIDSRFGPGLKNSIVAREGDFVYIAPDVPHQPVNLSQTEVAMAIVSRTDANEQESVMPYEPAGDAQK